MRFILVSIVLAGLSAPAFACLNDSELPAHEREFRARYRAPQTPPISAPAYPFLRETLLGGAGVLLLATAVGLVVVAPGGRKPRS